MKTIMKLEYLIMASLLLNLNRKSIDAMKSSNATSIKVDESKNFMDFVDYLFN